MIKDPFDGTKVERRIVVTPVREEKSILNARTLATAFWASYFALHWLTILEIVERSTTTAGTLIYFLVTAVLTTVLIAGHEATEEKKK